MIKKIPFIKKYIKDLNNFYEREKFIMKSLSEIKSKNIILDAGCGSQYYRKYCSNLIYKSQDIGDFTVDAKSSITGVVEEYNYGPLDYKGNIWNINEVDNYFDAILCSEVFEHIPYPIETVKEFSRLLKKGGKLILTAPSNCLRHFDPYFFYSGFSDRWFEKILNENKFKIDEITPVGDYYSWMKVEIARTMASKGILSKIILLPTLIFFSIMKKTEKSTNTLCMGYHIIATKVD